MNTPLTDGQLFALFGVVATRTGVPRWQVAQVAEHAGYLYLGPGRYAERRGYFWQLVEAVLTLKESA